MNYSKNYCSHLYLQYKALKFGLRYLGFLSIFRIQLEKLLRPV